VAVSCSRTYLELVSVSAEMLKIAFRVGAQVTEVCDELKQTTMTPASWPAIFTGVSEEQVVLALGDFHRSNVSDVTTW
jgi:Starter unit:ACP transacylase in aflatoxin biosynthesis